MGLVSLLLPESYSLMVWIFFFFFLFVSIYGLGFFFPFFFLTSKLPLADPKAVKRVCKSPQPQRKPHRPYGVFKLLPLMGQHVQLFKSKTRP